MAGAYASFEALIQQLMSADNAARSSAEKAFGQLAEQQPDALATELLTILCSSTADLGSRSESAILMRRVLIKKEEPMWDKVSPPVQGTVKQKLLELFSAEENHSLHRKISDVVSDLGIYVLYQQPESWQELLPFMFQCVQSQNPRLMEGSLNMFAQMAPFLMSHLQQHLQTMYTILQGCMANTLPLDVRCASLHATSTFMEELEDEKQRDQFFVLVPAMLDVIQGAVQAGEEKNAQEALECFIELAEIHPKFVRGSLNTVLETMMTIAEAEQLEESTRKLACEFVVTLCEAREQAPGMMRKIPQLNHRLFMCLMNYLLDVEDDPTWYTAEEEDNNEGEGELCEFGQECLDRVAIALGGNSVLHGAQGAAVVAGFLGNGADWRARHGALVALAQIAEGCAKVMLKELRGLVDMCLSGIVDPHPRVRWAACQAIGQMCTDLGPDIQEQEHGRILPALMGAMKDSANPRVQAHASAAVVNFTDNCDKDIIAQYLDTLISSLIGQLQHNHRAVRESALPALSSLADCAQQHFVKYYSQVMPLLFEIMAHAKERSMLRAKCMECVSLIAMAVGRDQSREDAQRMMSLIATWQRDADDPTFSYTLQAGARLCKCLGEEFMPYLDVVMPPLLAAASEENYYEVTNEDDEADEEEDDDVATFQLGDKNLQIRISALEEKATACNMLRCYADELKEGFFRFVQDVAKVMVPLLKFFCWEDVRIAAVNSLEPLLRSAKLATQKQVAGASVQFCHEMFTYLWQHLMTALGKESEPAVIDSMVEAVRDIVDLMPEMLTDEQKAHAFKAMEKVMAQCLERRTERLKRKQSEDFDEEEAEALREENELEEELVQQVANTLGTMLKQYKDAVMPLVEAMLPGFYPMLDKSKSTAEERRIALGLMDDMLEYAPSTSAKFVKQMVPLFMEAMMEPGSPDLNQCAVYGLGIVAVNFSAELAPVLQQVLEGVVALVQAPDARSKEHEHRFDNAISTLGKLMATYGEQLGERAAPLAELWISALPITEDAEEAAAVHKQLAAMVAAKDPRALGEGNKNLRKIAEVYMRVLGAGTGLATAEVAHVMVGQLQELMSVLPPEVPQAIAAQLKPKQQANLQAYMAGQTPS